MKTDLTTSGSFAQSKAQGIALRDAKLKKDIPVNQTRPTGPSPDYSVEINSRPPETPTPSVPTLPRPEVSAPKIESVAKKEVVKAVLPEARPGTIKKNAIIFIKGLDLFSSPSKSEKGYAGIGRIAESVEGARTYGWNQKDEIIKEVLKVHPDNKIILVGHSLGGDTAVEVANELDSLENKFRSVDLLITMDAIGFGNDIIPKNVKHHLNVFGENNFFLNDGPHVARELEKTSITNMLSPLDHIDIDDDKDIQREVVSLIQGALLGASSRNT